VQRFSLLSTHVLRHEFIRGKEVTLLLALHDSPFFHATDVIPKFFEALPRFK